MLIKLLQEALPGADLITDPDILRGLSCDEAEWAPTGRALVALRARSTEEVVAAVRICAAHRVPVVPRGAGTGLSGGANAVDDCLIIDLSRMNTIIEIDPENHIAVVQAGVVNDDFTTAVAEYGLWYPPDPASAPWSTIGGNVSTNAGGLCCLKYGVTRDYVLGMQVVMGGPAEEYGQVLQLGRRTTKGVAGYDLAGLFVGSEGTFGIVTEITVKLRPIITEPARTVIGAFGCLSDAGHAVAGVTQRGLQPAALELLDHECIRAVEDWKHLGLEPNAKALLLARIDTPGSAGDTEAEAMVQAFNDAGAKWAEQSTDEAEAVALFDARRLAYPALERLMPVLTEDICVPCSTMAEMLSQVEKIAEQNGVRIATIAHAGDGNLHPLFLTPPGDEVARIAAQTAFEELIDAAIALGGTVTGEHGVGLLKRTGMQKELEPRVLEMQKAIKSTLDPLGLFNPGKVIG